MGVSECVCVGLKYLEAEPEGASGAKPNVGTLFLPLGGPHDVFVSLRDMKCCSLFQAQYRVA
jgi:hypothetical protein